MRMALRKEIAEPMRTQGTRLGDGDHRNGEGGLNGYLTAVAAASTALGVRFLLAETLGPTPHPFVVLFVGAAMAAAWRAGFRSGLLATILGAVALDFFFIEPKFSFRVARNDDLVLLLSYIAIGLTGSWLCEDLRAARRQAAGAVKEQRQAREEAEAWRRRYEAAVASSRSILYDYDHEARRVLFEGNVSAILGYAPAVMPSSLEGFAALIHPEERERFLEAASRSERTGEPFSLEYRLQRQDGRYAVLRDDGQVLTDDHGRSSRIVGLLKDVTEERRAEQALVRGEAEYRALFEGAGVGNTEVDLTTGRFTRVNRRYCEMIGYDAEELLADKTPIDITHPDDRERNAAALAKMRDDGADFEIVKRYFRKDGRIIWVHIVCTLIRDAEGRPARSLGSVIDVTDRREAEERMRLAVEVAGLGVIRIDYLAGTAILDAAAASFFGLPADAPIPRSSVHDRFHLDDRQELMKLIDRSLDPDGDGSLATEHRVVHRDGSIHWLSIKKKVVRGLFAGVRRPLTAILAAADITLRKQAEQRIRESQDRLRLALAAARAGAWEYDIAAHQPRWSTEMFDLYRIDPASSPPALDVFPSLIHPSDRELAIAEMMAAVERGGPFRVEFRVRLADGAEFWIMSSGVVEQGVARGIDQDITPRKEAEEQVRASEQRLAAVLRATTAVVYQMNLESRFVLVNRRFEELFGVTSEEVRGKSVYDLFPEEVAALFESNNRRVLAERRPLEIEETAPHSDGLRYYASVKAPMFDDHGELTGIVSVSTDITDRKRAEERLRDADRRKDEFLATLAHELRNPLAPIRNSVQIIRMLGPLSEPIVRSLDMMDRQLGHLVHLVDDLLDVSRITRGKLLLRAERVALTAIADAAAESAMPLIASRNHEFTIAPIPPVQLDGDPTRLVQILTNLLTNAAKYTEPGGRITLSTQLLGREVILTVKDNGLGISPDSQAKVFDIFSQIDRTFEKTAGGLGIGLSLVKGLAEMHGGSVAVRSDGEGQGSEFTVRLPIANEN